MPGVVNGRGRAARRASGILACTRPLACLAVLVLAGAARAQTTIQVPSDQPTIQAGIDAASSGDTVMVAPGTYVENIDFLGKAIMLRSEGGAAVTTIDGNSAGTVVSFVTGESSSAVLDGFTVTGGLTNQGAGILVVAASPTIMNNRIVNNATLVGQSGFGAGVMLIDSSSLVVGNTIANNMVPQGDAGGLAAAGVNNNVAIQRNLFYGNTCSGNGGAMHLRNADALVINNTVVNNHAGQWGGGLLLYAKGAGQKSIDVVNTILWNNTAGSAGPQIHQSGLTTLSVRYSDVAGGWPGVAILDSDPLFSDAAVSDFSLMSGSPCIDTGDPASPLDPDGTNADIGAIPFDQGGPSKIVLQLRSGSGPVGGVDSQVTMKASVAGGFPLFTPGDFSAAKTGPPAFIPPANGAWLVPLPADPQAKWIAPKADATSGSALYAVSFTVDASAIASATLDFWFAVDNYLGDSANQGVHLNGIPVPGTTLTACCDWYGLQSAFLGLDVTSLLVPGENTLYVTHVDAGGAAGVVFSASLSITGSSTWEELGAGLGGSSGTPTLVGSGTLLGGDQVTWLLSDARPLADAVLVIGFANLTAPFKGGMLVPKPDLLFAFVTDFIGSLEVNAIWPPGIPSGFTTYFQYWIVDPAGPQGYAASNAVSGTTP